MSLSNLTVGFALTGSYCTFKITIPEIERIVLEGAKVIPIMSENAASTDTRFGTALEFREKIEQITSQKVICSIKDAEPFGPKALLDILVVAPCTGNTIAKIANGITDSCVSMSVKAHLRNNRPVVIAVSTNDGLSANAKNIGALMNCKNIYFVPFGQDDPFNKKTSLVAKMELIIPTIEAAMNNTQLQPVIIGNMPSKN